MGEFKSFVDIVTPDERFWIEVGGARFLCRRLTRQDVKEIEEKVFPHGREVLDSEIGYINQFLAEKKHGEMTPVQIASQAKQLGERLAKLRRERQAQDEEATLEIINQMVQGWEGVGSAGQPVPCTRENKAALPAKVVAEIIKKVQARANAQDEAGKEEEKNL